MARTELIYGDRVGLLIGRTECFALGIALNESSEPRKAVEIKERAKVIIDRWRFNGVKPRYPIDDKVLSLGLRRLRRFEIAEGVNRKWNLTEQGKKAVNDASTL